MPGDDWKQELNGGRDTLMTTADLDVHLDVIYDGLGEQLMQSGKVDPTSLGFHRSL